MAQMVCHLDYFQTINQCEILQAYFHGCPQGCNYDVLGNDLPNFVSNQLLNSDLYQQCLLLQKEQQPTCDAHHPASTRLCPCIATPLSTNTLNSRSNSTHRSSGWQWW